MWLITVLGSTSAGKGVACMHSSWVKQFHVKKICHEPHFTQMLVRLIKQTVCKFCVQNSKQKSSPVKKKWINEIKPDELCSKPTIDFLLNWWDRTYHTFWNTRWRQWKVTWWRDSIVRSFVKSPFSYLPICQLTLYIIACSVENTSHKLETVKLAINKKPIGIYSA